MKMAVKPKTNIAELSRYATNDTALVIIPIIYVIPEVITVGIGGMFGNIPNKN
jgi:hypothetical protein